MSAKRYLLDKLYADAAEYVTLGDTMIGQVGQLSVALNVFWIELLSALPLGSDLVERRAKREGWAP